MKRICCMLALLLAVLMLTGCGKEKPPANLAEFEEKLTGQEEMSLELFRQNCEAARSLLKAGVLPEGELCAYDPFGDAGQRPEGFAEAIRSGFYMVELDPEVFGISQFFVIPAGQRAMTAEEYLQLAQASKLPAGELAKEENSWIPLQNRQGNTSRELSEREKFWLPFQLNEVFRQRKNNRYQQDIPVGIYVGCGDALETLILYPTGEMDEAALQEAGLMYYRTLPEERRSLMKPRETEMDWPKAVAAAAEAVAAQTGITDSPAKDYVQYQGKETGTGSWTAALLYEDGASFLIELDSGDGTIRSLKQLPDNFLDIAREWGPKETAPE